MEKDCLTVGELPEFTPSGSVSSVNIHGVIPAILEWKDAWASGIMSSSIENDDYITIQSSTTPNWYSKTIDLNHTHSHTLTMNKVGANQAHNNLSPYKTAYIWLRID